MTVKWNNPWKAPSTGLTQQALNGMLAIIIYCCGNPDLHYKWIEEAIQYLSHMQGRDSRCFLRETALSCFFLKQKL